MIYYSSNPQSFQHEPEERYSKLSREADSVFLRMSDVSEIIRGGSGPCCCYNFSPCEPGFAAACRGTSVWRKQQTHGALMTVNKQIWINWFNLYRDDDGSRYPGYKHTTSPSRWVQEISWQPYIGEQTCWVTLVYLLVPSIARLWAETVI